jgi:hypothetical protein
MRLVPVVLVFAMICGGVAAEPQAPDPEAVVREDVRALSEGDGPALLALFGETSRIYALPTRSDRLYGPLSERIGTQAQRRAVFLTPPPGGAQPVQIVEMASAGPFVAAELRTGDGTAPYVHTLVVFRIESGRIARLWHLGRVSQPSAQEEAAARATVTTFVNQADPSARRVLLAADAVTLEASGDGPEDRPGDAWPDRLEADGMIALGDLVVVREQTGATNAEGLSAYRVGGGRILHRWRMLDSSGVQPM